jgi:hypothetical protein
MSSPVQAAALAGSWTFWADSSVPPYTPFGPVTVTGFSCGLALSEYGAGQAIIPVDNNALGRADLLRFYTYRLWALYQGTPVWAGLGTGLLDEGSSAVQVSLTELPGYLLKKQFVTTATYSGDQTLAAADLAQRLDNIGVARIIDAGPGRSRTLAYGYLDGQSRGDLLTALAQMQQGPQFRAEYALDGTGRPACTLRIAYPRVGSAASGLAIVAPGGAVSFQATWESDNMRNRTFAVGDLPDGAATGTKRPVITDIRPQAGVPVLDAADDWPGISGTAQLTDLAATQATVYASPTLTLAAVLPVSTPPLGSYGVGDDVSVGLADPLVPGGYVAVGQLAKIDIDAAAGTATWTVTVTSPGQKPRRSLIGRLAAAERQLASMQHSNMPTPPTGTET